MLRTENTSLVGRDIMVKFGGLTALADVNIDLYLGEVLGLMGPNGAGKTTLVNVLTGFQTPSRGEVWISGQRATRLPPHRVSACGVARTFQAARLFENLTVEENVDVAAVAAGLSSTAARRRSHELLEWVGCMDWAHKYASELPYGRERLVGIARALASAPSFLLLDEPAAGLNPHEADELGSFIRRIPERIKCGVLLIEHNVALVLAVCARIQVLDGGRTIALGTPDEITRHAEVRRAYLGST